MGHKKPPAEDGLLSGENIGKYLSLDATTLSNGEFYTILTNKNAPGKKAAIVAIV
jgi:transposase